MPQVPSSRNGSSTTIITREEYTICTAVAPEDVVTVRTYGIRQLYGHPAIAPPQSPQPAKPQVSNPKITHDMIVAQPQVSSRGCTNDGAG